MAIVLIQLPTVNPSAGVRPKQCRYCSSQILQRWGAVHKPLRDTDFEGVQAYRFRCTECGRTFRWYPEGVDRADMSQRLRCLAALAWSMGLSLRGVGIIFSAFGEGLAPSRMSVWRAVQEKAELLRRHTQDKQRKHKVRVLGVDGAWVRLNGKTTGVMVAVDMGDGQLVQMEVLDEHDPEAVGEWLRPLVQELGVEVMVTDDLNEYSTISAQLGVDRQICRFHTLRWVGKALEELDKLIAEEWPQWLWVLAEVKELVEQMPADGDERLLQLWAAVQRECGKGVGGRGVHEEATPLQKLAGVLLRLCEGWKHYTFYLSKKGKELGVPSTNNLTEQMIGNGKVRSRTVRGYKSRAGVLAAFAICAARLV